jgi:antirestriction protein ArdC
MTVKNTHPELLAQLEAGIATLTSSDRWRDYLVFQSRFHRYSYGNVLLIASQDSRATQVAGFRTWQRLGRFVRKGETAIWILAPMTGKRTNPEGEDESVIRGFRYVPVFDIAQTRGEAAPSICEKLCGDDPSRFYDRLVTMARSIDFRVDDHEFADTRNGDCSTSERRIRVESRNTPAQRVKTLAHELAHALLHRSVDDRALAELEAESTAFVVCRRIGLDTGSYSFGYVATWAGGGDEAVLKIRSSCDHIQKAASTILRFFEDEEEQAA